MVTCWTVVSVTRIRENMLTCLNSLQSRVFPAQLVGTNIFEYGLKLINGNGIENVY